MTSAPHDSPDRPTPPSGDAPPARGLQPSAAPAASFADGFRSSRLRGLHPGWFGGVMGTGILAAATYQNPGGSAALLGAAHAVGEVLAVITTVLAAVLVAAYIARWVAHFDAALSDLRHPVLGPLYGLFPGGLIIVAVLVATIGPALLPAGAITPTVATLTIIGALLAFAIAAAFTYLLFTGETDAQAVNGGWLIPPVVNIIVPMGLVPLLSHVGPSIGRLLMALSYAYFGIGFFLFILVTSMVHDRLVLHPLPHASLAPSLWIFLGPIGAGSLALLALAHGGGHFFGPAAPVVSLLTLLFVSAFWGFGLWALTSAALMLVRYLREGPLPYGLGWWGVRLPDRRLHRRDAEPCAGVAERLAGGVRRGAVRHLGGVLARRGRAHAVGGGHRRGLAAMTRYASISSSRRPASYLPG